MITVREFLEERCERVPENQMPLIELWEAYTAWAGVKKLRHVFVHVFLNVLEQEGLRVQPQAVWGVRLLISR